MADNGCMMNLCSSVSICGYFLPVVFVAQRFYHVSGILFRGCLSNGGVGATPLNAGLRSVAYLHITPGILKCRGARPCALRNAGLQGI